MGISFSSGRRSQNHHHHHHNPYYNPPPPPYTTATAADHSTLSPSPPPPPPQQPNTYTYSQYPYHYNYQYPPPQPHSNYYYPPPSSSTPPPPQHGWYPAGESYGNQMMGGRPNFPYFPAGYGNGWHHPPPPAAPPPPPPPYVEHQNAKVVKNDVNVHKDTIKLVVDEGFPDCYLVSFVFDAHFDGSITVYYFAKEDKENFTFTPSLSTAITPVKVPFQKGIAQRFQQPSGTGIDLGFFDLEFLEKPTKDDVFPLVIFAEVHPSIQERDYDFQESSVRESNRRVQATQAVIEKKNERPFQVKVIRQILWIDGVRYELRDIYGIGNASSEGFSDDDPGKECVICMTEPKNTAVIPCRHLCMCSDCAKELRLRTNKCPICRQPITELIEIKINTSN